MSHQDLAIRPFHPTDETALIALWHACGLTRPWNDPRKDIARKLTVQSDLFLVGVLDGEIVATLMGATTVTAAGSTIWPCRPSIGGVSSPRR